ERVELIEGVLHAMSPRGPRHGGCLSRLLHLIFPCVGDDDALVRVQDPITIATAGSEPEPDLVLAVPQPGAYYGRHPEPGEVLLLVEIADTTPEYDREVKGPLYAAAGITDYWIVNLVDDVVEVYREPVTLADGTAGYRTVRVCSPDGTVTPLHFQDCRVAVSDLIPELGG
ncbi:MAG: Uma2 family endonuclease, partial [Anaerolineae bacterium]